MNRSEYNYKLLKELTEQANEADDAISYIDVIGIQLGILNVIVADISKSLAIIADKGGEE